MSTTRITVGGLKELQRMLGRKFLFLILAFSVSFPFSLNAQNFTGYQVNGSAVNYGNGLIRMTESGTTNEVGSAWNSTQHDLTEPFDITVNIFFGCDATPNGADGIAFQMHSGTSGVNSLGTAGGFLGMIQNVPSVAVEFDTWEYIGFGDIPEDHITILQNGNANDVAPNNYLAGPIPVSNGTRDLEDCAENSNDYYTVRIVWEPGATQTLSVFEQGSSDTSLFYTGDMITDIFGGETMVWWGFTGSTGGGDNEQWIAPEGTIIPWQCETNKCCTPFEVSSTGEANICVDDTLTIQVNDNGYTQYYWSTGETTSSIEITEPGTYTVDVLQDQSGTSCPGTDTIVVLPIGVSGTFSGSAVICDDGASTTPLTVEFSGGTGPYSIDYTLDGVLQTTITGVVSSPYTFNSSPGPGVYEVVSVTDISGCGGFIDNEVIISVFPGVPEGNDATFCPGETVDLSVVDDGGTYDWYASATSTSSLNTGATFTTPTLSSSTTYYVGNTTIVDSIREVLAQEMPTDISSNRSEITDGFGGGALDHTTLYFTANESFVLKSIDAIVRQYGTAINDITVQLKDITDPLNPVITTASYDDVVWGIDGEYYSYTVPLNFNILDGNEYVISYTSTVTQAAQTYGGLPTFPYTANQEITITEGASDASDVPNGRWPGLFNWQIAYPFEGASCDRTPVTAVVSVVPDIAVTDPAEVCFPSTVDLTSTWVDNNASGGTVTYHTDISATSANEITDPTSVAVSGPYYVKIVNETCEDIEVINVTVTPKPVDPVVVTPVIYCEGATATPLTATVTAGNSANWYTLATGGTGSSTAITPSTSVAGTYYVSQLTSGGCESDRVSIDVNLTPIPTAELESGGTFCSEDLSGEELTVTVSGGTLPYSVSYTGTGGITGTVDVTTGTTGVIPSLVSGTTYEITTVTSEGCTGTITGETALIEIHPDLVVTPIISCDLSTNIATISTTISGGELSYELSDETPNSGSISGGVYSNTFLANGATAYSYTIYDGTGASALLACDNNSYTTPVDVSIDCSCELSGTLTATTSSTICDGEDVTLSVTPSGSIDGAAATYTVTLLDPDGLDVTGATIVGGVHSFTVAKDGIYTIKSIADGNCENAGSGSVDVVIVSPVQADIINPVISSPLDTQTVLTTFLNDIEGNDPGTGYNVTWSKAFTTQQGDISASTSVTTNLTNLLLVEPPAGSPFEGQGVTNLVYTIEDDGSICEATTDTLVVMKKGCSFDALIYLDGVVANDTNHICIDSLITLTSSLPVAPETGVWNIESGSSVTGVSGSNTNQGILNLSSTTGLDTTVISWTVSNTVFGCIDVPKEVMFIVYDLPEATIDFVSSVDTCSGIDLDVTTSSVNVADVTEWTSSIQPTGGPDSWAIDKDDLSVGNNSITYQVSNFACGAVTDVEDILIEENITLNIDLTDFGNICEGENVVYHAITTNDKSKLTYDWSYSLDPSIDDINNVDSLSIDNVAAPGGTVSLTITSSENCTNGSMGTTEDLVVVSGPNPFISTLDSVICETNPTLLSGVELGNGTNTTYQWVLNGDTYIDDENSLDYDNVVTSGTYTLRADNGDCGEVYSNEIQIFVSQMPDVNAVTNGIDPITQDYSEEIELFGSHSGASVLWTVEDENNFYFDDATANETAVTADSAGQFYVYLTSTSGECSITDSVQLILTSPLAAPNVFTPNGDGENDYFIIDGISTFPNATVTIYNRWGGNVYETENYGSNPWDADGMPDGVYYFIIQLSPDQEKGQGHSGVIHILR